MQSTLERVCRSTWPRRFDTDRRGGGPDAPPRHGRSPRPSVIRLDAPEGGSSTAFSDKVRGDAGAGVRPVADVQFGGSFDATAVEEARLAAADAAADGLVADRLRRGPAPDWTEMLWRHRRRRADQALKAAGVRTRVVVSSGRVRS